MNPNLGMRHGSHTLTGTRFFLSGLECWEHDPNVLTIFAHSQLEQNKEFLHFFLLPWVSLSEYHTCTSPLSPCKTLNSTSLLKPVILNFSTICATTLLFSTYLFPTSRLYPMSKKVLHESSRGFKVPAFSLNRSGWSQLSVSNTFIPDSRSSSFKTAYIWLAGMSSLHPDLTFIIVASTKAQQMLSSCSL